MCVDLGELPMDAANDAPGDNFVNAELRHHSGPFDTLRLPALLLDWIHRAEDGFSCFAMSGSPGQTVAMQNLDALRDEFDRVAATFASSDEPRYLEWVNRAEVRQAAATEAQSKVEQLAVERNRLHVEIDQLHAETDRLQGEVEGAAAERLRLLSDNARLDAERADVADRLARAEAGMATLQLAVSTITAALDSSRFEAAALRSSMSWRVTAPLRAVYRLLK
jgi:hypothetical protein